MTISPPSPPASRTLRPVLTIVVATLALLVMAGLAGIALSDRNGDPYGSGVEGSGTTATEIREVAPFASVDLAGSNQVSVTVGPEQSVRVRADDNLIDLVTTDVRAGELVIDNRGSFQTNSPMSVEVTLPVLDAVSLSGSGTLTAQAVRAGTLIVRLPGSGTIRASGATDRIQATLDGSGELQLNDLIAAQATAVVSGSGLIELVATETLEATVSGSGSILYSGNPRQVTKSIPGTGAIVER